MELKFDVMKIKEEHGENFWNIITTAVELVDGWILGLNKVIFTNYTPAQIQELLVMIKEGSDNKGSLFFDREGNICYEWSDSKLKVNIFSF